MKRVTSDNAICKKRSGATRVDTIGIRPPREAPTPPDNFVRIVLYLNRAILTIRGITTPPPSFLFQVLLASPG